MAEALIGAHEIEWFVGQTIYSPVYNLGLLRIPKNASTSLEGISWRSPKAENWLKKDIHVIVDKEDDWILKNLCVILRDPVDRFRSALNMFITNKDYDANLVRIQNYELRTRDGHFIPQSYHVNNLPKDLNIDYFYMKDNNVIQDIIDYYNLGVPSVKFNPTVEGLGNLYSMNLITSVNEDIIRNAYAEDYEIISSTKFVNL